MYKINSVKGMGKAIKKSEPKKKTPYEEFFEKAKKTFKIPVKTKNADPKLLNAKQKFAYDILRDHFESQSDQQFLMVISGEE